MKHMRHIFIIIFFLISLPSYSSIVAGKIKKLRGDKAFITLEAQISASPGATFKTSVKELKFVVSKMSPKGTKMIGNFSGTDGLEEGARVQFYGVKLVVEDDEFDSNQESKKVDDKKLKLDGYRIHFYGAMQIPGDMEVASNLIYDVNLGLGLGLEFIQEFSYSKSTQFGLGAGGEGYLPQSLETQGVEYSDAILPLHGFINLYYYIPTKSFEANIFLGGVGSLQNLEHVSLSGHDMSLSIGFQFGAGLTYQDFEARAYYRVTNHEYEVSSATFDATYNNIVLTLGYNF